MDELINGIVTYVTRMIEKQPKLQQLSGIIVTAYVDYTCDVKINNVVYTKIPILNKITTLSEGDSVRLLGTKTKTGYPDMMILGKI